MTTSYLNNENNMKTVNYDEEIIDIDQYRKLIRNFIDLRRYETALFWAEKVVQLSKEDPKDVYWQAQCMFLLKEYHRAAHIIKVRGLEKSHIMCHYLAVESLLEAKEYQQALEILNSIDAEDLTNTAIQTHEDETFMEQFGFDKSMKNEILSSISFLKGKVLESMDNRTQAMDYYVQALQKSVFCTEALDALVQHEMLMAWEERELMQNLPINQQCSTADAKIVTELYESKLKKYYDSAFPQSNIEQTPITNLNSLKSMRQFSDKLNSEIDCSKTTKIDNLNTSSRLCTPAMQNIMSPANKILYDLRNTPQYSIRSSIAKMSTICDGTTTKSFSTSLFKLRTPKPNNTGSCVGLKVGIERVQNSVDILAAKAEKLFYNCEYNKCLKILDEILKTDPYHSRSLTIQIGCLAELKEFNKLFYVAHKLVDFYPDQAISWYAVGCYYDIIGKSDPARRYLMKATSLDRLFGPAWLAYGHSFARENEHDQAMAAYFKATQLMRGCHLPLLYIGVECGLTKNLELADKFFYQALAIAPFDVFVLHELGVIKYEYEFYESAEEVFRITLDMVLKLANANNEPMSPRWEPLINNLGHCCRKNKKYDEAIEFHQRALVSKPQNAATYTAIGFAQALSGKLDDAINSLHKSLSLKRDDVVATTLLKSVIEDVMEEDDFFTDEIRFPELNISVDDTETSSKPIKLNCMKLQFEDEEDTSQQSEIADQFDISMEM